MQLGVSQQALLPVAIQSQIGAPLQPQHQIGPQPHQAPSEHAPPATFKLVSKTTSLLQASFGYVYTLSPAN